MQRSTVIIDGIELYEYLITLEGISDKAKISNKEMRKRRRRKENELITKNNIGISSSVFIG